MLKSSACRRTPLRDFSHHQAGFNCKAESTALLGKRGTGVFCPIPWYCPQAARNRQLRAAFEAATIHWNQELFAEIFRITGLVACSAPIRGLRASTVWLTAEAQEARLAVPTQSSGAEAHDEQQQSAALLRRCIAGDAAAWAEVVQLHSRRIYNICYRFTGSSDDAQDLAQEVFIKIYRICKFKPKLF